MNKRKIQTAIGAAILSVLSMSPLHARGYQYSQETIDAVYDMKAVTYADVVGWTHTSVKDGDDNAILDVYLHTGKVVDNTVNAAIYFKEGNKQCYTKESSEKLSINDLNLLEYFKSFDRSFNSGHEGYAIKKLGTNHYQMNLESNVTVVMQHSTQNPHVPLCK